MLDRNGNSILAGDIVRIEGAYFKHDNGLYFVQEDGTNPNYLDRKGLTLKKIRRDGRISEARYSLAFWPLLPPCSDRSKNDASRAWNEQHATIEIVRTVSREHVIEYFAEKCRLYRDMAADWNRRGYSYTAFGGPAEMAAAWYEANVARMTA